MTLYKDTIKEEGEETDRSGHDDPFLDDGAIDSDEDEAEQIVIHDQLPSPEETQVATSSITRPLRSPRRTTITCFPDRTTCALLVILVILLATSLLCYYFIPRDISEEPISTFGINGTLLPTAAPTPYLHPIEARLRSDVALRGGMEFDDVDSYQSKALQFLLARENVFENRSTARLEQIYALLCFYYGTGAASSWNSNVQWLKGHDECLWRGVLCDTNLQVKKLDVTDVGLSGEIPNELVLLEHLKDLILEDNSGLTGEIPEFLGEMNLRTLRLADCSLYGDLPFSICTYMENNSDFTLDLDCSKVLCQPSCCDFCY